MEWSITAIALAFIAVDYYKQIKRKAVREIAVITVLMGITSIIGYSLYNQNCLYNLMNSILLWLQ